MRRCYARLRLHKIRQAAQSVASTPYARKAGIHTKAGIEKIVTQFLNWSAVNPAKTDAILLGILPTSDGTLMLSTMC